MKAVGSALGSHALGKSFPASRSGKAVVSQPERKDTHESVTVGKSSSAGRCRGQQEWNDRRELAAVV